MLTPQLDIYKHLAPHLANKDVLEVGFGTGFGTLQYAPLAKSVLALEYDTDALKFAAETMPLNNVTWRYGDIERFWTYGEFEAAVMIEVLEHVHDWRKALEVTKENLCHGGKLYITQKNANSNFRKNDLEYIEWTAEEFYDALRKYFFSVTLYDYKLEIEQNKKTLQTPLMAVAGKE